MEDDRSIANLLSAIAQQYQKQILDESIPRHKTRLEVIRRLELISQSIKCLMKPEQEKL